MARKRKRKIVKSPIAEEVKWGEHGSKGGSASSLKRSKKKERILAARMKLVVDTPKSSRKKASSSDQPVNKDDLEFEALKGYFASKKKIEIKTRFKLYL